MLEQTTEQGPRSVPTVSSPAALQKSPRGAAGLAAGPDSSQPPAGTGASAARATPHPMPSAEIAKLTPDLYLFGTKSRARRVTKKKKKAEESTNKLSHFSTGWEKEKVSSGD